ncbi:OmpA family protein [Dyella silvae]|uniref:OmpA family protein n=1 Tax=Dyella silvae TaxID=2994424 RepID=UPI002263E7BA|nr:OmpA family protein [Dyella silvae]
MFAVACVLSACGNVSRNVARDGQSAESMVWPKVTDTTAMHKGGTFPNRDNLLQIHAGLGKPQLADLVGFPHFSEGVWGVREWNYVFNFREPTDSNKVVTCQFKILFDENKIAQSFYWSPESCARFQKPEPKPEAAPAMTIDRFTFATDALFAFDRYSLSDIAGAGRAQLDELVQTLQEHPAQAQSIRVLGYTDRLGSDAYNQTLSQERAETARSYLISHGIDSDLIAAEGLGAANPVKACADAESSQLIACLSPNRRVEILVTSTKTVPSAH